MLGRRLTELRKSMDLTQEEIAKKLHLTRSTYAQYEVDRRVPEYGTLEKLANFFDVSIDYLVGRSNNKRGTNEMPGTDKDKDADYAVNELIKYLDELGLTNDEIIKRMKFEVDGMPLSEEEADEFIEFVRVRRLMKKRLPASASKPQEL